MIYRFNFHTVTIAVNKHLPRSVWFISASRKPADQLGTISLCFPSWIEISPIDELWLFRASIAFTSRYILDRLEMFALWRQVNYGFASDIIMETTNSLSAINTLPSVGISASGAIRLNSVKCRAVPHDRLPKNASMDDLSAPWPDPLDKVPILWQRDVSGRLPPVNYLALTQSYHRRFVARRFPVDFSTNRSSTLPRFLLIASSSPSRKLR